VVTVHDLSIEHTEHLAVCHGANLREDRRAKSLQPVMIGTPTAKSPLHNGARNATGLPSGAGKMPARTPSSSGIDVTTAG
jgi:hypothetical protein